MKISVIVASHRPDFIRALCDSLLEQTLNASEYDVIIVADYNIAELQRAYNRFIWLYVKNKSISVKRNMGAHYTAAEIVAFIDDDCIADREWLLRGRKYLLDHLQCSAVEGLTTIEAAAENFGMIKEYRRLEKPGFRTNNIFYRKNAFDNVGGFDERFTVQREDADLAFSVLEKGGRIDYCQEIKVQHRFRFWEKWDLLKNCWNRRFDPLLLKKHPLLYRKHIKSPLSPTLKLLISLFSLTGIATSFQWQNLNWSIIINLCFIVGIGIRRSGLHKISAVYLFFNIISVSVAPIVVIAALLTGSVRFKKLLIF